MPEYVRVRLENGVVRTLPADHPAASTEGVEVLDRDATDDHGHPLPEKIPTDLGGEPAVTAPGEPATKPATKSTSKPKE